MRQVRVPAFAKINLTLKVLWRRPDGFHDIATVFQTIDLCDWLTIEASPSESTNVFVSTSVPIPGENIAKRAADMLLRHYQKNAEVRIHIEKRIPLGGGLGGSSTDGSAVLLALPQLLGLPLELDQLEKLGAGLGSDVNFFLHGGTASAFGRGDHLELLPELATYSGHLVSPGMAIDSGAAYRALRRGEEPAGNLERENFQKFLAKVRTRPISDWGPSCGNDFELVAFAQHPELASMFGKLQLCNGKLTRMSGSGSSLYTLEAANAPTIPYTAFRTIGRQEFREHWETALAKIH